MSDRKRMNRRGFLRRGLTLGGAAIGGGAVALNASSMLEAASDLIVGPKPSINGIGLDDPNRVQMSLNENSFGASRLAIEAVSQRMFGMNRYPFHDRLEEAISAHIRISESHILTSGGSTEILNLVALAAYYEHSGNTITGRPSYFDIPGRTTNLGGIVKRIPTVDGWGLDLDGMAAAIDNETRLVNICNPNNPTGQILDSDALESFIRNVPESVIVLVDEAYIEFAGPEYRSMMQLTNELPNLIVARTFSKVYGLAGIRVGYGVAQPGLLRRLTRFNIGEMRKNALSTEAAIAALGDQTHVRYCVDMVKQGREYLYRELDALGHEPVQTDTNFMPVKPSGSPNWLMGQLAIRNVLIRSAFEMDGYVRITVGQPHENEALVAAMKDAADNLL
jgi:histidinol-phosphate aminotransferase